MALRDDNTFQFGVGIDIYCEQAQVVRISPEYEFHTQTVEGRLPIRRIAGQQTGKECVWID